MLLSANLHPNKCNILHFLSGPIHSTLYFFLLFITKIILDVFRADSMSRGAGPDISLKHTLGG